MIIAELLQLERDEGDEGGRFFLESRKKQRTCVVDGKAAGFKLGVALATPVAGESLNRPDESKLFSVRFLLSPLVWLRQPAPIASACHGSVVGCGNQTWMSAIIGKINQAT